MRSNTLLRGLVGSRPMRAALAAALVIGLMPIGALASDGGAGLSELASGSTVSEAAMSASDNCIMVKVLPGRSGVLDGEPVVASMGDRYYLEYGSAEEAKVAAERLRPEVDSIEFGRSASVDGANGQPAAESGGSPGGEGAIDSEGDGADGQSNPDNESAAGDENGDASEGPSMEEPLEVQGEPAETPLFGDGPSNGLGEADVVKGGQGSSASSEAESSAAAPTPLLPEIPLFGLDARSSSLNAQAVKAAGGSAVEESQSTSLRTDQERLDSLLPAQTIVMNNGGELPLRDAAIISSNGIERTDRFAYLSGSTSNPVQNFRYGIWLNNPKTDTSVDAPVTLKWYDIATDRLGNHLDLTLSVTKATFKQSGNSSKRSRVLILNNTSADGRSGFLRFNSRSQMNLNTNEGDAPGVKLEVTCKFTYTDTDEPVRGAYLFSVQNLDVGDRTNKDNSSEWQHYDPASPAKYAFAETMQFVSGFKDKVYFQKDTSVMKFDRATGRVYADLPGNELEGTPHEQYRCGLVAVTDAAADEFKIGWWGNGAATTIFQQYRGVVVNDRNDPTTPGVTDQGIVKPDVNTNGQQTDEDQSRTSSEWRSTELPWRGDAEYVVSAKPGFRVEKVQVKPSSASEYSWQEQGSSVTMGFKGNVQTGPEGATFETVQDYDVLVTTAKVDDAIASIVMRKELVGRALKAGEFSFELLHEDGTPVYVNASGAECGADDAGAAAAVAENDADGNVALPALTYIYDCAKTYPVTHTYLVREVYEEGSALPGVTYDMEQKTVRVEESYDEDAGVLSASLAGDGLAFTNTYDIRGGVSVKKTDDEGNPLAHAVFEVRGTDSEYSKTIETAADGIASIPDTELAAGKYTVREKQAPEGYQLNETWSATFSIDKHGQHVDLTGNPCVDSPRDVNLPMTGAGGLVPLASAALAAATGALGISRRYRK